MHFVYLLKSIHTPEKIYIGSSKNIAARLQQHNDGKSAHTTKYKPWKLVAYIGFENQNKAFIFEKYLKTGSGRVFIKRHLL